MNSEQSSYNYSSITPINRVLNMKNEPTSKKVLFVCYGNICRSPSAQGIFDFLAAIKKGETIFESDSAGTHDFHVGKAPDPRAITALENAGLDISGLRGRQISERDFVEFDHIIVMDQRNLDFVSEICPAEYFYKVARITDFSSVFKLTTIPDPFHGVQEDFENMVDQLFIVCKSLLDGLSCRVSGMTHLVNER